MARARAATGAARPAVRPAKLAPATGRVRAIPPELAAFMVPRPGGLVLVHAPAGYRKTVALAVTHQPDWLWYNADLGDHCPLTFGGRLSVVLDLDPLPVDLPAAGGPVARALADRLRGRDLAVTVDRFERMGPAPELGVLLVTLLTLVPGLALRIATRTRPALPFAELRGPRLVDVGPSELRLRRDEIESLLAVSWDSPPDPEQVDFADGVLDGWPAAVQLWQAAGGTDLDAAGAVSPSRPLRDYLDEEVLPALASAVGGHWPADAGWLLGPGALSERAATPEQKELADRLVDDRVGVVFQSGGWRLHPLVAAVVGTRTPAPRSQGDGPVPAPDPDPDDSGRATINAFGRLEVRVAGRSIDEAALPCAARRLLELLLCVPGYRVTSEQAAGILWPRHLRHSALNAFSVALHILRRLLEPDLRRGAQSRYLRREGRAFRLRVEELHCDLVDFRALLARVPVELDAPGAALLAEAALRYRGDFLAAAPEGFAREPRAALREEALAALERLGAWHAAGARWAPALVAYDRLLELEPRREDVWAHVLRCHLESGDEAAAVEAARRCERALRAAGVEPSGLLRELRDRVRDCA